MTNKELKARADGITAALIDVRKRLEEGGEQGVRDYLARQGMPARDKS